MSWNDNNIVKIIGQWLAPTYFPDPKQDPKTDIVEINAKSLLSICDNTIKQYGGVSKKSIIDIRILYPEYTDEELRTADVYSELIYTKLIQLKKAINKKSRSRKIGYIRKAHQNTLNPEEIKQDILRDDCFIIIVLTADCAKRIWWRFKHENFMDEMKTLIDSVEIKKKNKNMFLPLYLYKHNKKKKPGIIKFMISKFSGENTPDSNSIYELDTKLKKRIISVLNSSR